MIILGLGSNIGDRLAYLGAAVKALSALMDGLKCSRILESAALLPADATADMNRPFLNMAVSGTCSLAPEALLQELKRIERDVGRIERCKWGPREIDIDILAWENIVFENEKLAIPHKELLNRDFALVSLAELAPNWRYPVGGIYHGKTAAEIMTEKRYGLSDKLRETALTLNV